MSTEGVSGGVEMDRRTFAKTVGVSAGAAAASSIGATSALADDEDDDEESGDFFIEQEVAVLKSGYDAVSSGIGSLFGSSDSKDAEEAAEEATHELLEQQLYEAASLRKDSNVQLHSLQGDIIELSQEVAYDEAIIQAWESIDEQKSQSDTLDDALEAKDEYYVDVQERIVEWWNKSCVELETYVDEIKDQGFDKDDFFSGAGFGSGTGDPEDIEISIHRKENSRTLLDGSTIDVHEIEYYGDMDSYNSADMHVFWDPTNWDDESYDDLDVTSDDVFIRVISDGTLDYLEYDAWNDLWEEIEAEAESLDTPITEWIDDVYDDLTDGDLPAHDDVLARRQIARRLSEDENVPIPTADNVALGTDMDPNREFEVRLLDEIDNAEWTITGLLSATDGPDSWEAGETYDADDFGMTMIIAHTDAMIGDFAAHGGDVDGGEIEFTAEPHESYEYVIHTGAGETATAEAGDFEQDNGSWETDIGDQLDDQITSIEAVDVYFHQDIDTNETFRIDGEFEILSITDEDGTEVDSAEPGSQFEYSEPDDIVTEDDLEQFAEDRQNTYDEIAELFEEVEGDDDGLFGGLFSGSLPSFGIGSLLGAIGTILLFGAGFLFVFFILFLVIMLLSAGS